MNAAKLKIDKCWYCGNSAAEIWNTTWDEPGEYWPFCNTCADAVRYRLQLRIDGKSSQADIGDLEHGIDTRGVAGRWVLPVEKILEKI